MPQQTRKEGWCRPSQAAKYAGVSVKQFRGWMKNGLRYVELPNGRQFTKFYWIDAHLEQFEVKNEAKQMAEELVQDL
jgi:predicted site-specific integrase-resolvase